MFIVTLTPLAGIAASDPGELPRVLLTGVGLRRSPHHASPALRLDDVPGIAHRSVGCLRLFSDGAVAVTKLAEAYFRPRAFEYEGRFYRWMGVPLFKRLLMKLVQPDSSRRVTNGYRLGGRSLDDVQEFERISRRSELIHLLGLFVAIVFLAVQTIWGGLFVAGLVVFAANFHCFLLQRYNRARVYRIVGRARDH